MKKGLILEGGAMRGMFTAGVMDVLMEKGIEFDGAVGVSAGAVFGCNYKSKQIGRVLRFNVRYCQDKRYSGLYALITDGNIFSKDFCYGEVPLKLDVFDFETFEKNPWSSGWSVPISRPVNHVIISMTDSRTMVSIGSVLHPPSHWYRRSSRSMVGCTMTVASPIPSR